MITLAGIIRFIILGLVMLISAPILMLTQMRFARQIAAVILWVIGITDIKVYGEIDPRARVICFNHPNFFDALLLMISAGPCAGLIANGNFISEFFKNYMDCVQVSKGGGENTTKRVKAKMATNTHRYAIAINRNDIHEGKTGGQRKGDRILAFKTLACRVSDSVQPVVIVTDNVYMNVTSEAMFYGKFMMRPLRDACKIRVYMLPRLRRGAKETVEAYADRVQGVMNKCLAKAWAVDE